MEIVEYIKERLDVQIEWYDKHACECKKYHDLLTIVSLACTSSATIFAAISIAVPSFSSQISILSAVAASTATVMISIDKLKKYQELHTQYRSTCEKLKQVKYLFLSKSGEYIMSNQRTIDQLFIERCESMISTEIGTWTQINEKKQSN